MFLSSARLTKIALFSDQLRLCAPPVRDYNWYDVYMLTSQRVMMLHKKIIEYHGRIENVKVFDKDPT